MKCNVGKVDRVIRIALGICVIAVGLVNHSWLGLIGVIPLATATLGWCPLYIPFGFSSCKNTAD